MPDHIYDKNNLIMRFEAIRNKKLGEIDNKRFFEYVRQFQRQKGVAGDVIEQCVLGYDPDSKQEADLIIIDGTERQKTELKVTGMLIDEKTKKYVAKEPMSITGVGVYDISDQEFETSHFWNKLERMLIVYYLYASDHVVDAYGYKDFPVKGYEFHEFSEADAETLRRDWEYVHDLVAEVVANHPGPKNKAWKDAVKEEYLERHGYLRRVLTYVDLAPKFPPRFRLKKPIVSSIISNHFGYELEQLPGKYAVISDVDRKCKELTSLYRGMTIRRLAEYFNIALGPKESKSISEKIIVSMFGGTSSKLNQIDLFERFGLIAKTIVLNNRGGRTEDMKLFHIDFDEMKQLTVVDDDENREFCFEDSEMYSYFADHALLCVIFEETSSGVVTMPDGSTIVNSLYDNRFVGFKRLVFTDEFIDGPVRNLWNDTRSKVINGTLCDVVQRDKSGNVKINRNGSISSAPNFMKSKDNDVFVRGSGIDSSPRYKTECVNGIRMLPQYVWVKGVSVIDELSRTPEI